MTIANDERAQPKTQSFSRDETPCQAHTAHLLVIEDLSSRRVSLPRDGVLVIGRSPDVDVQVESTSVSRRQAKLILAKGEAQIVDLGSHNGTLVNGERVIGSVPLSSGDVVTIGESTLVLRGAPRAALRRLIDMARMRQRLDEELARAADYDRPFAVLTLHFDAIRDQRALSSAALAALRGMDVLAAQGSSLVAFFPELEGEAARAAALALLEATAPWATAARAGLAGYPSDGCDADTLLAGSRQAATVAEAGIIRFVSESPVEQVVRGRTVIIADPAMIRLYSLIRRLAPSDLPVLIQGETGTGKENAASALHDWSDRSEKPFVAVNCAALPETLIESELFGHERGAFTGASSTKVGLLERAAGGTVFFDELGELAMNAQAKMLRALQEKKIMRVGDTRERDIDVRIVAATNHQIEAAVRAGRFREDLMFRLKGAVIEMPPLRCRRQEVPLLARCFVDRECARAKRTPLELSAATLIKLSTYVFPGNVRELENMMRYAVVTAEGPMIQPWDLPTRASGERSEEDTTDEHPSAQVAQPSRPRSFQPLAEELRKIERARMLEALDASGGVQRHAAALIGMPIRTFTLKLKQYSIARR